MSINSPFLLHLLPSSIQGFGGLLLDLLISVLCAGFVFATLRLHPAPIMVHDVLCDKVNICTRM